MDTNCATLHIVEAHGGRIWAQNNADGKGGATFTFTLPLARPAPPSSPAAAAQSGEGVISSSGSSAQP